ncbi:hypothetical protein [Idiomarina xiamenensis]|uniref:YqaE/Pmp3 family membrane protein n=1 Tax=Idiomarina xiamenensis 10-D-4 TaxID=740709 RepID=K2KDW3_9GAMM|nr:hypothetical protein [Idiomarina xiamenensis]EKE80909.1 hypothetical protein A10D4_10994 [Idiomarina xiamenensis 10-D-4]
MRYLFAILLPPLAILSTGKVFQAIFNLILCAIVLILAIFTLGGLGGLYLICIIHALFAVHSYHQDQRDKRIIKHLRGD